MKIRSQQRGAALVVTLAIIILAVVLVVGLTMAMRMERSASFYNLERVRAEALARIGVDYGKALLMETMTNNRFWVSSPGRLRASAAGTFDAPTNLVTLSSGFTTSTNANDGVNLNRLSLTAGDRTLDPGGSDFSFRWVYVNKDGTYTNVPSTNTLGRFAFWMDDESTRVDLNTADQRTSTLPAAYPSQISLGALPGLSGIANDIALAAQTNAFITPYDALGRDSSWTNGLFSNRFFLTHYTQDADLNPWNERRRILTTRLTNAPQGRGYFDILSATNGNPGLLSALNTNQLANHYRISYNLFTRNDWPYAKGSGFQAKFGIPGVQQMALDVIEYLRAADSANTFPEPLVAQLVGTNMTVMSVGTGINIIPTNNIAIGTTRRPMISQVGMYCSTNTNALGFVGTLHGQLYLPPSYNAGTGPFNWQLWAEIASSSGGGSVVTNAALPSITFNGTGFADFMVTNVTIPATLPAPIPTNSMVRLAILKTAGANVENILDVAPLVPGQRISLPTTTNTTAYAWVNDPRLNKVTNNWMALPNLPGDVAPPVYSPNYSAFAGTPASDGSTNSLYFPVPGSGVQSIGDLGYLATGVGSTTNAPWRSLRLQANSSTATNIPPDWALLDLFYAPVPIRFLPGINVTAGRVNLNALITDGTNASRANVLNALFTNAVSDATLPTVLSNVMNVRLVASGNYGQATNGTNFVSAGQLAEVPELGDQGEAGEAILRKVVSLATVRGNVFSVYSVGQAIQFVNGRVVVNGEKSVRVIVERAFDNSGTPFFRILLWNEISP